MMTKRSICLGVAALLMSAGSAVAAPQMRHNSGEMTEVPRAADMLQAPQYVQVAQNRISATQAKSIALSRVRDGEYVDLRLVGNVYIVRVRAPGGRIVDIRIDAATGQVK